MSNPSRRSRRLPSPLRPRCAAALLLALLGSTGGLGVTEPLPGAVQQPRPAVEGNRGPLGLAASLDGERVYVTEAEANMVAAIGTRSLRVQARHPTGGEQPSGVALAADGKSLLVCNTLSGSLARIDLADGSCRTVPLPGAPWAVVPSADGRFAYVSLSQLDAVARVDLAAGKEVDRVAVGRRPKALARSLDGKSLLCANLAGGSLSLIDLPSWREVKRLPVGGVNVRGIGIHPNGTSAYVTLQPPLNAHPASYPIEIWHNFVRELVLAGEESRLGEEQWMDFGEIGCADQEGIAVTPDGRYAFVAVGGRHTVARITLRDPARNTAWPLSFQETAVGANPRGLILSPDGSRVWVANYLGNSVIVLDSRTMGLLATISLGPAPERGAPVYGRFLFSSAHLARGGRFSCNSCHPDGASDGLVWRFTHVPDGIERRNSRDLRSGVPETPPFRWSGHDARLEQFIQDEVRGLFQGPRPEAAEVDALRAAIGAFRLPPNPHRHPSGELTASARRGEALFAGKAGCAACHSGPRLGGTGKRAWIATTPSGLLLDVPHLSGVYDSPPYLHDGRAASLEEIFTKHKGALLHGTAHTLASAELADLLEFVREQ